MKLDTYKMICELAPFLASRSGGVISRFGATDILVNVFNNVDIFEAIDMALRAMAVKNDIPRPVIDRMTRERLYWLIAVMTDVLKGVENDEK